MINFSRKDPAKALDLAKGLADEERVPYKICLLGGKYHIRHASVRGSAMAIMYPSSVKTSKDGME